MSHEQLKPQNQPQNQSAHALSGGENSNIRFQIESVKAVIGAKGSNAPSFYATADADKLKFDEK